MRTLKRTNYYLHITLQKHRATLILLRRDGHSAEFDISRNNR